MVSDGISWWRRSRWALLALVVLVPAAVAASLSIDAVDYGNAQPREITAAALGDTARIGEATLRVVDTWTAVAGSAEGVEYGVPEGAALVSVTLELDATAASEGFSCSIELLQPDRGRRWTSSPSGTDYWPGRGLPDDVPTGCTGAEVAFPFELTFLVPEDAAGDVVLEVVNGPLLPRAFRLLLV